MSRIAGELVIAVTAASLIAALVLVSGDALAPPAEPTPFARRSSQAPADGEGICLDAPVVAHSAVNVAGEARLCLTGRDVLATARVSGLRAGAVYTAWLSYVDQPAVCRTIPCGPIDLLGDSPVGLLERIDGGVVPSSGTLELAGALHDLEISSGAQVTLLLVRPRHQTQAYAEAAFIIP